MRFGHWMTKRLGGCVPARSWRRKKKASASTTPPNTTITTTLTQTPRPQTAPAHEVEVRLTRRWVFVRESTEIPPSPSASSASLGSLRSNSSTDPLTGPPPPEEREEEVPSSPRSCELPSREVTRIRKSKSTASIPRAVIRKLSVPIKASPPPAAHPVEGEVIDRRDRDLIGERVCKEGEGEGERRVDEDPVRPVTLQAAGESCFAPVDCENVGVVGAVSSVIVQSTAAGGDEEVYIDIDIDIDTSSESDIESDIEAALLLESLSPPSTTKKPPTTNIIATSTITDTIQLPTPSASSASSLSSHSDSAGLTPTPPDTVDEEADQARVREISGWCLQHEEDQDLPGPGSLQISTYPYPRSTPILSDNHRLCQPKASILKPFPPPLIHPDHHHHTIMSTSTSTPDTKPAAAPAAAPPAKGKKGPAAAADTPGEKKLTGKELKEAKKAEKQARRAADKLQRSDVPDAPAAASVGGAPAKQAQSSAANQSTKQSHQQGQGQQSQKGKQQQSAPPTDADARTVAEPENKRIPFFEHLRENKPPINLETVHRDVHPSILRLSLKIRNFEIIGSTARCLYMLLAFKEVISDYVTPEGAALSRNLTQHLNLQISQIAIGRKLSVSQGNAIRWLKTTASRVPPEIPDEEAKKDLIASIDTYMKERILVAQDVIANVAAEKIVDGDVILTYARSSCVERILRKALSDGKRFTVIVIDSRPYFEGRVMAKNLTRVGIQVKYTTLHAIDHVMKSVNKVFLGAHAVYANGACYSRAGTSTVAMAAAEYLKPVMVCCEGLKLSDKIVMDSITTNELGPTEALIGDNSPLQNHAEIPNLHIVNLLYDLTSPKYITAVITETGFTPPFGIPSVFRLLAEREGTVGAS
ncbi:hypothetical protein TWF481_000993 [Arthrobotrys musiformis]|uniref:Translation initiation factor eIF2B subunit delta n=1 Tax=Arthrobotrys musiformis TaxID=47236 RepID=A0AAV9WPH0_9PEZI